MDERNRPAVTAHGIRMRLARPAVLAWLLFLLACAAAIGRASFTADLSAFLPRSPSAGQRVLVEQLRDGLVSRLIGMHLPGRDCLFQKCQLGFIAPVYPGTTVRVTGTVEQISEVVRSCVIKVKVADPETGTEFVRGKVNVGFTEATHHG